MHTLLMSLTLHEDSVKLLSLVSLKLSTLSNEQILRSNLVFLRCSAFRSEGKQIG